MLKFAADAFVEALSFLGELDYVASHSPEWLYRDQSRLSAMDLKMKVLAKHADTLGLRLSAKKIAFLQMLISGAPNNPNPKSIATVINNNLRELRERLVGELEVQSIYFVDAKKAEYLKKDNAPFGSAVADKLPLATEDIAEATQCLGLSRNTATVFHLMRAMEVAVHAVGEKLRVTIVDKDNVDLEWGKILANIKIPIEAMGRGVERDTWSEVLTLLYHVKQAWRNNTMHPKQTYGDEEAKEAYDAVQAYMRKLAALV